MQYQCDDRNTLWEGLPKQHPVRRPEHTQRKAYLRCTLWDDHDNPGKAYLRRHQVGWLEHPWQDLTKVAPPEEDQNTFGKAYLSQHAARWLGQPQQAYLRWHPMRWPEHSLKAFIRQQPVKWLEPTRKGLPEAAAREMTSTPMERQHQWDDQNTPWGRAQLMLHPVRWPKHPRTEQAYLRQNPMRSPDHPQKGLPKVVSSEMTGTSLEEPT